MTKSAEALVKPELLVWARKSAGLTVKEAARKVGVKPERLENWESGKKRPTVKQLEKLGNVCKRPLAVFYLSEPPKDFQPIHDFRRLPGEVAGIKSPQLIFQIRLAQERRELAIELFEQLEGKLPTFSAKAKPSASPEDLARKVRQLLGITVEEQAKLKGKYDTFNKWRAALERVGVVVFQARDVKVSEMRGFSIAQRPFPAVVVNIKDAPQARVFTMLHEFVHILLGDSGLCDLYEETHRDPAAEKRETFCNHVAGAILVPKDELLNEDLVLQKGRSVYWSNDEIAELAARYGASREVLLRRLLILERTTNKFYQKKRKELLIEYKEMGKRESSGFAPPHRIAISTAGPLFIRLVLNNYYQEKITSSDLSAFLNIKLKHMGRIEDEIMGHRVGLGAIA